MPRHLLNMSQPLMTWRIMACNMLVCVVVVVVVVVVVGGGGGGVVVAVPYKRPYGSRGTRFRD